MKPQRGLGEIFQESLNGIITDHFSGNGSRRIRNGLFALGEKLQSPHAVAPNLGEQAVGIGAARADFLCNTPPQVLRVRQQVLENSSHRLASVGVFP